MSGVRMHKRIEREHSGIEAYGARWVRFVMGMDWPMNCGVEQL